jgi:hypothetical protein
MHREDWLKVAEHVNMTCHGSEPVRSHEECILAFVRCAWISKPGFLYCHLLLSVCVCLCVYPHCAHSAVAGCPLRTLTSAPTLATCSSALIRCLSPPAVRLLTSISRAYRGQDVSDVFFFLLNPLSPPPPPNTFVACLV